MTVAENLLIPKTPGVLRVTCLYVGQGDATLLTIPDGSGWTFALIDCNRDEKAQGIDVAVLLQDLLQNQGGKLDVFINTHPHQDHIAGVGKIHETTPIREVWHSGHEAAGEHKDNAQELQKVIDDVGAANEFVLFGTHDENHVRKSDKETKVEKRLGDMDYLVLSPAQYVTDDVHSGGADERYRRIHEMCGVIQLRYGNPMQAVMITGDAERKAWEDHIMQAHKSKLPSVVLRSSHHGSDDFFKFDKASNDAYDEHLKAIDPEHVVVSAPKQSLSKHDHPDDYAMGQYKDYVGRDKVYHLGAQKTSTIIDIHPNGHVEISQDKELAREYRIGKGKGGNGGGKGLGGVPPVIPTKVDNKPFG